MFQVHVYTLALPEAWWCVGLPDSVAYHIEFIAIGAVTEILFRLRHVAAGRL